MDREIKKAVVELRGSEIKEGKTGKFVKYQTNIGAMNCFDDVENEKLANFIGQKVNVEIEQKGDFKNIKAFLCKVADNTELTQEGPKQQSPKEYVQSKQDHTVENSNLMTAADLFKYLYEKMPKTEGLDSSIIMGEACKLVKLARKELQ